MTDRNGDRVNMDTDETPLFCRYCGWVQPAVSVAGVPLGWMCNWRNDDNTWPDARSEEPGHLHPTQEAAIDVVIERIMR